MRGPLTASADTRRPIPDSPGDRSHAVRAALTSLRDEQRRLERLGFEEPLARCHQQLRYWEFVAALIDLPSRPPVGR